MVEVVWETHVAPTVTSRFAEQEGIVRAEPGTYHPLRQHDGPRAVQSAAHVSSSRQQLVVGLWRGLDMSVG